MRLWSIHPKYLDTKGLVAVWREGLLALHVLRGQTKGYTKHPQLIRFQNHPLPIEAISAYLHGIADEADSRSFIFQRQKLLPLSPVQAIPVTSGQLQFEAQHLKKKLQVRDEVRYLEYESLTEFATHPLFQVIPGEVETWEKVIL